MVDFQKHLELLETRITLLERQVARLSRPEAQEAAPDEQPQPARTTGDVVQLPCDHPGIIYSRAYQIEANAQGRKFCWLGAEGPIQIVLPVAPSGPLECALLTFPHSQVSLRGLRLVVNDVEVVATVLSTTEGIDVITFEAPQSHASQLDVWLHDVVSVRPSELGEGDDDRLLALCFYGAIATYQ